MELVHRALRLNGYPYRHLFIALVFALGIGHAVAQVPSVKHGLALDRLVPGTGWTQATVPRVHAGPHFEATCIARWTRVPQQDLWLDNSVPFRLGLLAYHRSKIDMVRFAVDGGPWYTTERMRRSAQTGHYGYSATLAPADFSPGWHEVRALIVPRAGANLGGTERVLIWRFYNASGELPGTDYEERWVDPVGGSDQSGSGSGINPYFSLRKAIDSLAANPEGARIHLKSAGSTPIPFGGQSLVIHNDRPITIVPEPGHFPVFAPQSSATLDQIQVRNLRLEGLAIDFSFPDMFDRGAVSGLAPLLLSNCNLQGFTHPANSGHSASITPSGLDDSVYLLDCRAQDFRAILRFQWGRGVHVNDARGTVQVQASIDSEIRDFLAGGDTIMSVWSDENGLVDGVGVIHCYSAVGQLSGGTQDGTAIVNSLFDGSLGFSFYETVGIFSNPHRHLLVLHCSFVNSHIQVNSASSFPGPFDMQNGLFFGVLADFITDESLSGPANNAPPAPSGLRLDPDAIHTHRPRPLWSNWTRETLLATFADYPAGDFRVASGSLAAARISAMGAHTPFDMNAKERAPMTALGALKAEEE